jgi:hypothetical protein
MEDGDSCSAILHLLSPFDFIHHIRLMRITYEDYLRSTDNHCLAGKMPCMAMIKVRTR